MICTILRGKNSIFHTEEEEKEVAVFHDDFITVIKGY